MQRPSPLIAPRSYPHHLALIGQALVEDLYHRLIALKLRVWLDVKCLKPGQPWEDGFADGLFASAIFVPVLSKVSATSMQAPGQPTIHL